jgi:lysyl-tRNA synthetase class 2
MAEDFLPTASLDMLRRRAELLRGVRRFFESRGFLEVETPILSQDVVVDRHLDPLSVTLFDDARRPTVGQTMWLQTSPEFGMKRLLAAGAGAIYQITRAFRGAEFGPLHNPEFTMVEWYRTGDDYQGGMLLLAELADELLHLGTPDRLSYQQAFVRYAGFDCFADQAMWPALPPELALHGGDDFALDYWLTTRVAPQLGRERPTILYDYPATQAALARVRPGIPPVAERFELFVNGVELANGYHELLDPAVLQRRNSTNNQLRLADGKSALPESSRLLSAMEYGLPPSSGCALGFDRLVLVATGAKSLAEVIAFPLDRA